MRSLIIDHRERNILNLFTIDHEIKTLIAGDYYICLNNKPIFVLERKTLYDLSASIKDNRIYEQIEKLKLLTDSFGFIIEGDENEYIKKSRWNKHLLNIKCLNTRLNHMKNDGLFIIRTKSTIETVDQLECLITCKPVEITLNKELVENYNIKIRSIKNLSKYITKKDAEKYYNYTIAEIISKYYHCLSKYSKSKLALKCSDLHNGHFNI